MMPQNSFCFNEDVVLECGIIVGNVDTRNHVRQGHVSGFLQIWWLSSNPMRISTMSPPIFRLLWVIRLFACNCKAMIFGFLLRLELPILFC